MTEDWGGEEVMSLAKNWAKKRDQLIRIGIMALQEMRNMEIWHRKEGLYEGADFWRQTAEFYESGGVHWHPDGALMVLRLDHEEEIRVQS